MAFLRLRRSFRLLIASLAATWMANGLVLADEPVTIMGHEFCCPVFTTCTPRRPIIKYKCTCPKPICDPCSLEHYGYYPTCWRPWLEEVDYSHCPVPPPTVLAPNANLPLTGQLPNAVPGEPDMQLPPPNKSKGLDK